MRAATCFSGIGAPETAMPDWRWFWSAEVEPFPAAVHAARHPGAVNLGDVLADDFLQRVTGHGPIDVLVGGPPCQAFSIAGARGSLSDPRGNLSLRWVQIIHAVDPVWSVTENVPGWLSTGDNAFGCFLGALVGHDAELRSPLDGGRWPDAGMVAGPRARAAWRVLDAQHFGVPQRRRRVFVVASSRAWADPAAVLFEPKGMRRHPEAGREARERVASPLAAGSPRGSGYRNDADTADNLIAGTLGCNHGNIKAEHAWTGQLVFGGNNTSGPIDIATACNAHGGPSGRLDFETETFVACVTGEVTHTLTTRCGGRNAGEDGTGRGTPIIPCAFDAWQSDVCVYGDRAAPLDTDGFSKAVAMALTIAGGGINGLNSPNSGDFSHADAPEANAGKILLHLRDKVGAQALSEWCLGVLASFRSAEVLFGAMFRQVPDERKVRRELVLSAQHGAQADAGLAMRALREAGRARRPPSQWRLARQPTRQLRAYLSRLPQQGAPPTWFLHDLRSASQGARLLQQALVALEEARRSACLEDSYEESLRNVRCASAQQGPLRQTLHAGEAIGDASDLTSDRGGSVHGERRFGVMQVRRLTPRQRECEKLQGFQPGFTAIDYRGKPAADGPRYKAIGNSMCVNVMRWILRRVEAAHVAASDEERAA